MCPVEGETGLKHQVRMSILIWASLFFSMSGSIADTGAEVEERRHCLNDFCITLNDGEITAEAGLCALVPCSFTTNYYFRPQNMVWFKCEPSEPKCSDSDMIFHSNKNSKKIQPGFRGRVSLLEPVVSRNNCSIIINDLTESDSGSYQLRVNGYNYYREQDGFLYPVRATVSVRGLIQKPTVMIPPLKEGQQTTLTCTAPGLCSGSDPRITWTWRGRGENDSHITGNVTACKTENLTAITRRHSSTLTFIALVEHHGTEVTCKVSYTNNITTEKTMTLNVTYVKEVKITGNPNVKEGEMLNLICSVESFPPSLLTWTKYSDKNMQNGTETKLQNDTLTELSNGSETYTQEESGMATFFILNTTAEDFGQYICTTNHQNNTLVEKVAVTVTYMRKPVITGDTAVEVGDVLNLTCSVDSFPPSRIIWTTTGSNTSLDIDPNNDLQTAGSAALVIHKVTTEHSGLYICTAQHVDTTVTVSANVSVTLFPKIVNSRCKVQSEVLTCTCVSEGIPLPTITWSLLKYQTDYSVFTTVSKHTVNSTIILTVKDHTGVDCVGSNENGEAKENVTINASAQEDQPGEVLTNVSWPEVIIAFLFGVLLSAVICCLATKFYRIKQKSSGNLNETLMMATSQADPLIDVYQEVEHYQTYYQDTAGDGEETVAAEKADLDNKAGLEDVEYATIDFSALKRKNLREAAKKRETTTTEYAEIKKKVKVEREGSCKDENEVEGKEEAAMILRKDEETKSCALKETEEADDMTVYSSVKDVVDDI